jgi:hypothetical protein
MIDLTKVLVIAADLRPVIEKYKQANSDGKISVEEGLGLAVPALEVLVKHEVTIADLTELAKAIGPLLPMLKELSK